MLTIKTNNNNCKLTYTQLGISSITTGETVYDDITITTNSGHNLRENDEVAFVRQDGELISYFKGIDVKKVINKNEFTINGFGNFLINVSAVHPREFMLPVSLTELNSGITKEYIRLTTNEHIFVTNKDDIKIKRRYLWDTNSGEYKYEGALTMCDGDYYLFDDLFLIKNINNTDVVCENINLNITATTVGYEPILLNNCLIGVDYNGNDDRYHIYIPYEGNEEFVTELDERIGNTTFTTDDIRFLYKSNNQMEYGQYLQPGTYVNKVCGNLEVDFNIGENFEVNLHHEQQVSNYIEKVKNESINKIIDYERQQYTPMFYDGSIPTEINQQKITVDDYLKAHSNEIDDKLKQVTKINFRLHFRDKIYTLYDYDGNVIDKESGNVKETDYVDFGTWETDDNGYWNNYILRSDHTALEPTYKNYNIYGDLLGYLGFTDDDVYYQKDALKKSFLRLSFYDSPNRETQKLLYYSTIYFDTNKLSSYYINDLTAWRENPSYTPQYNQLVFAYDIVNKFSDKHKTSGLTAEMSCTDKYDDSSSSDGFYIHLFDKLVSGNTCTPIYVKAEFNNAKFGKTVPMIRPIFKDNNKPIPATNSSFPREYMRSKMGVDNKIYSWIDMDMLLQDMYIKIYIKYDFKTNQYVWFVPEGGLGSTLTFDLFEPRVKGYDFDSYRVLNGDDVGYGTVDGTPTWFQGDFIKIGDEYIWVTPDGKTEAQWAKEFDGCCLMTTATTLPNENMLNGTKLFNKGSIKKIDRIWIDGIMVYDADSYDAEMGEYKTNYFQLPDIPFTGTMHGTRVQFPWNPPTTQECWDDQEGHWYYSDTKPESKSIKPKIIHSVNYYFKTNISDESELFNELYLGIYNKKEKIRRLKTIETTEDIANILKNSISKLTTGEKLPNGMFAGVSSLRCVKTVDNVTNVNNAITSHVFTTIGNGTFSNCQSLVKVDIEKGSAEIIGKHCFSGCRSLKTAKLTDVKVILREAFQGCFTLTRAYFTLGEDAKTKYIGCGAFGYTKLREISIPNTVIRIANSAYRRCYQLNNFSLGQTGDNKSNYFYGPNTYFDEETGEMHIGDPDLYTFTDTSTEYPSELETIGKRAFGDCAILKYNLEYKESLVRSENKYIYHGGVSEIILALLQQQAIVNFFDTRNNKYISLALSTEKDRGKLTYHFKDEKYKAYCNDSSPKVYVFYYWNKYLG